jgi:ankyrin repeat protein
VDGNEGIVGLLMDAGADPDFVDKDGETALSIARRNGHKSVIQILSRSVSGESPRRSIIKALITALS